MMEKLAWEQNFVAGLKRWDLISRFQATHFFEGIYFYDITHAFRRQIFLFGSLQAITKIFITRIRNKSLQC